MAYITNKKRNSLVKSINENYTLRKILIIVVASFILLFVIISIVSVYEWFKAGAIAAQESSDPLTIFMAQLNQGWSWFMKVGEDAEGNPIINLSAFGWWMAIWIVLILIGSVFSAILTFTMKSPKTVRKDVKTLESAALSGRKLTSKDISTKIMRERTSLVERKPKKRG